MTAEMITLFVVRIFVVMTVRAMHVLMRDFFISGGTHFRDVQFKT